MAEAKPVFVDIISEATRQNRRRAMPVDVDPMPASKPTSRMAHTPPRLERWRHGDADALEDQDEVLEVRDLGLSDPIQTAMKNRRPHGRLFRFSWWPVISPVEAGTGR